MKEDNSNVRSHALDNLRVFAFLMLIFYHTAIIFTKTGWHIKGEYNLLISQFADFMSLWRLDILFAVSGAAFFYASNKKCKIMYLKKLSLKIIPAILIGVFILIPPVYTFESGFEIGIIESYKTFILDFLNKNFRWLHFWYLGYILIISTISIIIFKYVKTLLLNTISIKERSYFSLLIISAIPLVLIEYFLRPIFPVKRDIIHDLASISSFTLMFLYGSIFFTDLKIIEKIKNGIMINLFIIIALFLLIIKSKTNGYDFFTREILSWVIIMTFTGVFFKYFNLRIGLVNYINKNLLLFYCIHQLCILSVGSIVIKNFPNGSIIHFLLISFFSIILSISFIFTLEKARKYLI